MHLRIIVGISKTLYLLSIVRSVGEFVSIAAEGCFKCSAVARSVKLTSVFMVW